MSIIYHDFEAEKHAFVTGVVTRNPEYKETKAGGKMRFAIRYGKGCFMDCEAWADGDVATVVQMLAVGDIVLVTGKIRSWEYNGKPYSSLDVDFAIPMALPAVEQSDDAPHGEAGAGAKEWSEAPQNNADDELPF